MGIGIGKASEASGCKIETIRYYEHIGLIPDPGRGKGGHRVYDRSQVERLRFIKRARELGFGLDDIRDLLVLSRDAGCNEAQAITDRHLKTTRDKIRDLARLERVLSNLTVGCDKGNSVCPILVALQDGNGGQSLA